MGLGEESPVDAAAAGKKAASVRELIPLGEGVTKPWRQL
jgi:hypothetical protein